MAEPQRTHSSREQAASLRDEGSKPSPPSIRMKEGKGENSSGSPINPASSKPSPDSWPDGITSEIAPGGKVSAENGEADTTGSSTGSCHATCA